jgi:co-chaperonin GroES (HSP10)
MPVGPLHDRVLIERIEEGETVKGGSFGSDSGGSDTVWKIFRNRNQA